MELKSRWRWLASIVTAVTVLFLSHSIAAARTVTVTEVVAEKKVAVEVVVKAKARYKKAKKRRAKIIAKSFVKQGELNVGSLEFLLQNLRRGKKIKRKHFDTCRGISRMIIMGVRDLDMGRIDRAESVVIRVVALEVSLPTAANAVSIIRNIDAERGNSGFQVVSARDIIALGRRIRERIETPEEVEVDLDWEHDNRGIEWGWWDHGSDGDDDDEDEDDDTEVIVWNPVCEDEDSQTVCESVTSPHVPNCWRRCRKYYGGKVCRHSNGKTIRKRDGWWSPWYCAR